MIIIVFCGCATKHRNVYLDYKKKIYSILLVAKLFLGRSVGTRYLKTLPQQNCFSVYNSCRFCCCWRVGRIILLYSNFRVLTRQIPSTRPSYFRQSPYLPQSPRILYRFLSIEIGPSSSPNNPYRNSFGYQIDSEI